MKKLLYITFSDLSDKKSGSSVRPRKMLDAFKKMDLEIDIIQGQGLIFKNKERNVELRKMIKKLESTTYDYCYIESMSGPISGHLDRKLIKTIHEKGIKSAYFLRDDYYRLGREYIEKTFKNRFLIEYDKIFSYLSNKTIDKYIDIVYFPSLSFSEYFTFKRKDKLQPAGEIIENAKIVEDKVGIYVGSCSKAYGTDILLDLFDKLNGEGSEYKLNIVTNVESFKEKYGDWISKPWLSVVKASGDELKKYYDVSKVAFLLKDRNLYNDLSVSVKIYEYFSHGKSVVFTDCLEQKKIAEKSKAAIVVSNPLTIDDVENIKKVFDDTNLNRNALDFIKNGNTWYDRAKKVITDLDALEK